MSSVGSPLRVALVSSPRTGNHWLRHMLGDLYGLPEVARHVMHDEDWDQLPAECILQIHWPREAAFLAKLGRHGFVPLTVARHPFDVLISVLHVAVYDIESELWLGGRGGDEAGILGAMPRSRAFLDYASGPRAADLLSVTCGWWLQPGCLSVRFEECVSAPGRELAKLLDVLGPPRRGSPAEAIERASIERRRRTSVNNQYWKGQPGLWRELLPAPEAQELATAVQPFLEKLGYVCDPDPHLDARRADANWVRHAGRELHDALRGNGKGYQAAVEAMHQEFESAKSALEAFYEEELQRHRDRLAQFAGLTTGLPVRVARVVQRLLDRSPRLTATLKRTLRRSA